ncbi:S-layer homology domain-containing protein [Cytobacillus sp. IB215316]|uniref:S-layer homology domain-containing protein n=1 Tax=Cytobacillus sp. IB215316 TaxID=3097354 RepID=UPI002A183449|nr:S-layer homology domain-containing protein [Cytobacillus sp. IB215316]MDX8360499.1 S-layer homology domain-containing protein [Cytobacillus sp. IB215316]
MFQYTRIFLAFILVLLSVPMQTVFAQDKPVSAYLPTDLEEDYWAYTEINHFIQADIINGYLNNQNDMEIRPNDNVTRSQFVKILVNAMGLQTSQQGKTYTDVTSDDWFYEYVNVASNLGIVNGKEDGSFAPYEKITRDQLTAMIVRAFENTISFEQSDEQSFTDVTNSYWAYEDIEKASSLGIVKGYDDETFKPRDHATRAQAVVMIYRSLNQELANVPTNDEITSFLRSYIENENELSTNQSFDELEQLYINDSIGFYQAQGIAAVESYKSLVKQMKEEVVEFAINADNNFSLLVTTSTDRYVTVQIKDLNYEIKIKNSDLDLDVTSTKNAEGKYYLKKDMQEDTWKIYAFSPSAE